MYIFEGMLLGCSMYRKSENYCKLNVPKSNYAKCATLQNLHEQKIFYTKISEAGEQNTEMHTCTSGSEFSSLQRELIGRCFLTSVTPSVLVTMATKILRQEECRVGDWENS